MKIYSFSRSVYIAVFGKADMTDSNIIYIGKKDTMIYVSSAIMELLSSDEIIIKARGNAISTAVNVSMIVLRKTKDKFKITDTKLDEEQVQDTDENGQEKTRAVSSIQITIGKKEEAASSETKTS